MEQEQQKRYRAWAEIDLNALTHNVQTVQKLLPAQTQYMAVVKANAYGHGDEAICRKLWELGVRWFAVSNLEEALSVRQFCPYGEIFILGYTPPEFAPELAREIESRTAQLYTRLFETAKEVGALAPGLAPEAAAFFFDNLLMMLQFSYSCDYYQHRMRLYCGEPSAAQDAWMTEQLTHFILSAMKGDSPCNISLPTTSEPPA